jgi:hypothetical protein
MTRRATVPMMGLVVAVGVGVACSSGCISRDIGLRETVEAIAKRLQPDDQALAKRLLTCPNPQGEGTIVFIRSDTDCGPRYSWISVDNPSEAYALDEASKALTPSFTTLAQAGADSHRRVGFESSPTFDAAVRQRVCMTGAK